MITINIMFLLKIISLICLGLMMLFYIIVTFKEPEHAHFLSILVAVSFMAIPFFYIFLN